MSYPHTMNCLFGLVCGFMMVGACSSDSEPSGGEPSSAGTGSAGTKGMAGSASSAGKTGTAGSASPTAGTSNGSAGSKPAGGSSSVGGDTSDAGADGADPGVTPGGTCKAFAFKASGGFTVDHMLDAADKCSVAAPNGGLVISFIFGSAPDTISCTMLGMGEAGATELIPASLECQKSPSIWSAAQPGQCKVALTTFTATTIAGDVTCSGALQDISTAAGGAGGADSSDGLNIETWTFEIAF